DAVIERVVKIEMNALAPDFTAEFVARDHHPGTAQQRGNHSQRLLLQADDLAAATKFQSLRTEFKLAKGERFQAIWLWKRAHGTSVSRGGSHSLPRVWRYFKALPSDVNPCSGPVLKLGR